MDLMLGTVLHHKEYGEVVVSEIIDDKYISVLKSNNLDDVKYSDSEEFFYKTAMLFRMDALGKKLHIDEDMKTNKNLCINSKVKSLKKYVIKMSKELKKNRCEVDFKKIKTIKHNVKLKKTKVKYTNLVGNKIEVKDNLKKIKMYCKAI